MERFIDCCLAVLMFTITVCSLVWGAALVYLFVTWLAS